MPNVTVRPPSTINVRVGPQNPATVQSITYGTRTLKSATDLLLAGAQTGDVIQYDADTRNFTVGPLQEAPPDIDGGYF